MGELVLGCENAVVGSADKFFLAEGQMIEGRLEAGQIVVFVECTDQCGLTALREAKLLIERRTAQEGVG